MLVQRTLRSMFALQASVRMSSTVPILANMAIVLWIEILLLCLALKFIKSRCQKGNGARVVYADASLHCIHDSGYRGSSNLL